MKDRWGQVDDVLGLEQAWDNIRPLGNENTFHYVVTFQAVV
jgi:hypothetical protein